MNDMGLSLSHFPLLKPLVHLVLTLGEHRLGSARQAAIAPFLAKRLLPGSIIPPWEPPASLLRALSVLVESPQHLFLKAISVPIESPQRIF